MAANNNDHRFFGFEPQSLQLIKTLAYNFHLSTETVSVGDHKDYKKIQQTTVPTNHNLNTRKLEILMEKRQPRIFPQDSEQRISHQLLI